MHSFQMKAQMNDLDEALESIVDQSGYCVYIINTYNYSPNTKIK